MLYHNVDDYLDHLNFLILFITCWTLQNFNCYHNTYSLTTFTLPKYLAYIVTFTLSDVYNSSKIVMIKPLTIKCKFSDEKLEDVYNDVFTLLTLVHIPNLVHNVFKMYTGKFLLLD